MTIKFFKILVVAICFFILQNVLELIFMSILAKLGITYMDVEVRGESFVDVIEGISLYYFYWQLLYAAPVYLVLIIAFLLYLFRNKEISFKNIAIIHLVVSLLVFLVLWFAFGNGFTFIVNPLLGLLLAAGLIYLLASQFKKPLIKYKAITA
jgi:hypothetical protein